MVMDCPMSSKRPNMGLTHLTKILTVMVCQMVGKSSMD